MSDVSPDRLRIRRVPDGRRWFGRAARYEVEWPGAGASVERETTMNPGSVIRRVTGLSHPADLADFTQAADLGWDGAGTGLWRGRYADAVTQDPVQENPDAEVDPAVVQRRAQQYVDRFATSLAGALQTLTSILPGAGAPELAAQLSPLLHALREATSDEERSEIASGLSELWERENLAEFRPSGGSLTERAVCRMVLADVPRLSRVQT